MKSNFISAIAGWKSAALLALVAMVAAVAFSGVLSTTQTAEAAKLPDVAAGAKTTIANSGVDAGGGVQFAILSSSTASASFVFNGKQAIFCIDNTPCDKNSDPSAVSVEVIVAADAAANTAVVISRNEPGDDVVTDYFIVTRAPVPTRLTITPSPKAISAASTDEATNSTQITIRLTDENGKGIGGQSLDVTAGLGTLGDGTHPSTVSDEYQGLAFSGGTQSGTVTTSTDAGRAESVDGAGWATVELTGAGATGTATVTVKVTRGTLSNTSEVVLYGGVATITASSEQGAIAVGESTYIVVEAKDGNGNPVANAEMSLKTATGNVPPTKLANPVEVDDDANKEMTAGSLNPAVGDIPSCDAHVADTNDPSTFAASTGTDSNGKCVIKVTAGAGAPGPADDAARGTHTITIVAGATGAGTPGVTEAVVEIQVGGAPATVRSDAPPRIDTSAEVTVNLTVVDDENVRVGEVDIEVLQTAGDGTIITEAPAKTKDGRAKFTYLAPSTPGKVEFLARTKNALGGVTAQLPIIIDIGPDPEEAPDAPPATWSQPLATGTHNLVWNGDDGADPSAGASEGVTAIWRWNGSSWDGYFPLAADVPGGNTLESLTNGAAYWVIVE